MSIYFKGSGSEYLDTEFEKLLGVLKEKGPSLQKLHAKAGAIGGLYFLIAFAKENNIVVLPLADQMLSKVETDIRYMFERMWVHREKPVGRMKERFLCDLAVGYNHMLNLYQKKYPNVGIPGTMTVTGDANTEQQCKTGAKLIKTITSKIPAPPTP